DAKVASQQKVEQLAYDYTASQRQADIARATATGTADAQAIINCGWHSETADRDGQSVSTIVPNANSACPGLTPEYLQLQYIQALQNLVTSNNASTVIM